MLKPAPTTDCDRQATDNLDQALSGMLDALRKPLKLTATLKRRALKNKGSGNRRSPVHAATEAPGRAVAGEVESPTARVAPSLIA